MPRAALRDALPFAFAVFDLDGDGKLAPGEFREVLEATLALQALDGTAISRVLAAPPPGEGIDGGLTRDQFRYFASLSAETILGCCGFMMHVRDFYVPLSPLGPEAEEAAEAEVAAARLREDGERERVAVATAARPTSRLERRRRRGGGRRGGGGGGRGLGVEFVEVLEARKSMPEGAARCKDQGNALLGAPGGPAKAAAKYTEGLTRNATPRSTRRCCATAPPPSLPCNWGGARRRHRRAAPRRCRRRRNSRCSRGARARRSRSPTRPSMRAAGVQPAGGRSVVVDGELQAAEGGAAAVAAPSGAKRRRRRRSGRR